MGIVDIHIGPLYFLLRQYPLIQNRHFNFLLYFVEINFLLHFVEIVLEEVPYDLCIASGCKCYFGKLLSY